MPHRTTAPDQPTRLLRLGAAAALLGIGIRTLQTLIASGKLKVIQISSRRIGIDMADIESFIARQRR